MTLSKNKPFGKNKYYNIQKGKKENHFFFLFPSIVISPKKFLHWDIRMFSIFLGWGKYYIQFNIFETIKNTSTEVLKPDMVALLSLLKSEGLTLSSEAKSMNQALEFLNKNSFLTLLLKNGNLEHPYLKEIISSYFRNQNFIIEK